MRRITWSRSWFSWVEAEQAVRWECIPLAPMVSRPLLERWTPPRLYRPCYREMDYDAVRYAIVGLHLVLKAWHWWRFHRWCVERVAIRRGWMVGPEGGYYREFRWRRPAWRPKALADSTSTH